MESRLKGENKVNICQLLIKTKNNKKRQRKLKQILDSYETPKKTSKNRIRNTGTNFRTARVATTAK